MKPAPARPSSRGAARPSSRAADSYLLLLLNITTAVFSAFLDNTTTALLMGPVTIQLCELMKADPNGAKAAEECKQQ